MSLLLRPDSHTVYTQEQRLEQQLINDQSLAQQQQQMRAVQQQPQPQQKQQQQYPAGQPHPLQ